MKLVLAILCALLAGLSETSHLSRRRSDAVRIERAAYYPFHITSLDAIDESSIWLQYDISSLVRRDSSRLLNAIDKAKSGEGFARLEIRLGLVLSDGTRIFVDKAGHVMAAGKEAILDGKDLVAFYGELHSLLPAPPPLKWTVPSGTTAK
jgi:hypothetical protein